jgi:hypothetical protein
MTSPSFARIATCTASTKRPPAITGGKAGVPVTQIASLACTRPVTPSNVHELEQTFQLGTLSTVKVCYTQDNLDIKTGDILVIASGDYAGEFPIKYVGMYGFGSDVRKELAIEVLKR